MSPTSSRAAQAGEVALERAVGLVQGSGGRVNGVPFPQQDQGDAEMGRHRADETVPLVFRGFRPARVIHRLAGQFLERAFTLHAALLRAQVMAVRLQHQAAGEANAVSGGDFVLIGTNLSGLGDVTFGACASLWMGRQPDPGPPAAVQRGFLGTADLGPA